MASLLRTLVLSAAVVAVADASRNVTYAQLPRLAARDIDGQTCATAKGIDFVGNDIANRRGDLNSCCGQCKSTPNCQSYTWTNYGGGTCWLKGNSPILKIKADAVSCRMEPTFVHVWQCSMTGNDLGKPLPTATSTDCYDPCAKDPKCVAATWIQDKKSTNGICYFKTKLTGCTTSEWASTLVLFK